MVNGNLAYEQNTLAVHSKSNHEDSDELNWCSVLLSEVISRGKRLEATVFDVEGRRAREIIEHAKCEKKTITGSDGISEAHTCARFKRNWVEHSAFPIYQPSSILELYPKPDGYIASTTDTNIDALRVHRGQILLTCSGTIGKAIMVTDTLDGKIFSHDLLRITCRDKKDAGFLYAFIKSEVGSKILTTNQYGAVVSHIEASHLSEIRIPFPEESIRYKISELIEESFRLRDEANVYWERSLKLLYESLKLDDFLVFKKAVLSEAVNTFSVKLSDLSGRVDASFHNKMATEIVNKLKSNAREVQYLGSNSLSDKIFLPGRFKRTYVAKGHGTKMFGIKQITTLDPFTEKYLALGCISKQLQKELLLEPSMILISRSGTIGNLCIVPPHWKHWIASEDLIRIQPKKELEGYIYCFLASDYGQSLIKRYSFGSVQDHIDCEQVAQFPIPRLRDATKEQEINNMVKTCNELRASAYEFEMQALTMLENAVLR